MTVADCWCFKVNSMINLENGRWIWIFYYAFFLLIFVYNLIRFFRVRKMKLVPLLGAVLAIFAPIWAFFFAIGRGPAGPSEFVYLYQQLLAGDSSAWITLALYILTILLFMWSLFLPTKARKNRKRV